mmetsp:Transcript_14585/g.57375  ORF Transcript_14585/g.57375 Transcript_14585/m.57375 type:complete len:267 (+) Transcript_14585:635-1435(+)
MCVILPPLVNHVLQPRERASADEEDVGGVHLYEIAPRVFPPALLRDVDHGSLDHLQERLLHAFAGDVARDGEVLGLSRQLVDLVDVDDAALRRRQVEPRRLQQLVQQTLHVFADVPSLRQRRGVRDDDRDVHKLRQRLREERLSRPRRPAEENVGLLQSNRVELGGGRNRTRRVKRATVHRRAPRIGRRRLRRRLHRRLRGGGVLIRPETFPFLLVPRVVRRGGARGGGGDVVSAGDVVVHRPPRLRARLVKRARLLNASIVSIAP